MEPECSSPHLQKSATNPYPQPGQSSPITPMAPLKVWHPPRGFFPSDFSTKILYVLEIAKVI